MSNTSTNSTLNELDPLVLSLSSPFVTSCHIFNFCPSIPLNIYIIVLLIRAGRVDRSAFPKLNQAVSEIVFALQTPLFILCFVNMTNLCLPQPISFITALCLSTRFLFQCYGSFEHYLAVVQPVAFLKYKSMKYHLVSLVFIWTPSLLCAVPSSVNVLNLPYTAFGILFILILSVHLSFFFSILKVLRRPGPGEKTKKDGGVSAVKKKALKVVSLSFLVFLIQFTPLLVAFIMKNMVSSDVFYLAFIITMNINNVTGIVQPILYLHQMGKVTFAVLKCRLSAHH